MRLVAALCLECLGIAITVVQVVAATPRITFDRDSIRAGDSLQVSISGFDPKTAVTYSISGSLNQSVSVPWTNSGYTYPTLSTDRTDAAGTATATLTFSKDYQAGPQTVCVTETDGTGACQQFELAASVPSASNTLPLIVGILVFVGLALGIVRMRSSWLECLPGVASRKGVGRRIVLAGYGLLSFSFLFASFAVYAIMVTLFAVFRRSFRSSIPLIRQGNAAKIVAGWFLWFLGLAALCVISIAIIYADLADQTDPTVTLAERLTQVAAANAALLLVFALIGLGHAVWTIVGNEHASEQVPIANSESGRQLAHRDLPAPLDFAILTLATPLAITRLKMPAHRAQRRAAWWLFVIASWLVIFALLAAGATYQLFAAHDAGATDLPWFAARYLICALVVVLGVWVVRHTYLTSIAKQRGHRADSSSSGFLHRLRSMSRFDWMVTAGEGITLTLLWAVLVGLAAWPWVSVELVGPTSGIHANAGGPTPQWLQEFASSGPTALAAGRLWATVLVAVPLIAISAGAIYLSLPIGRPEARVDFPQALRRVSICAVLVAIAFVFAGSLVEYSSLLVERGIGEPIAVLLTGVCVGLATGLAMGMAREFEVGKRWTEATAGLTALGFCLLIVYVLLIIALQEWNTHYSPPSLNWIAVASGGVAGLYAGFIFGDLVLIPGLKAFSASGRYLKELLWPLVGFAAGYVCILLLFGAIYLSVHETACARGADYNFTSTGTSATTSLNCTTGFREFVYFSFNTIAPLGYSDLRPASDSMKAASALELGAGIAWTLVIFGGVLAHLNDRHVRKIVMDSLMQTLRRGSIFGAGPPNANLKELEEQLKRQNLSLAEQFAVVSGLKRAFWKQPDQGTPVIGLMQKMLGLHDLYYLPAQELEAVMSLASQVQRKDRTPSNRVSRSLIMIAVVAILVTALTAVATSASSRAPVRQTVNDTCVGGQWVMKEEHTIPLTAGVDLAGGQGVLLTVGQDGTAEYDYGASEPLTGVGPRGNPVWLQISGLVMSRVRTSSSGSWNEVPQSLQRFHFADSDGKSGPAWPTLAQNYLCTSTSLVLTSQTIAATYSRK